MTSADSPSSPPPSPGRHAPASSADPSVTGPTSAPSGVRDASSNEPPAAQDADLRHRPVRSFVVRAGRMGSGQVKALRELGPRFVVPYAAEPADWDTLFGRRAPRVLEIGFGMGQATAEIAAARPDLDFIGVEVHEPGVGALLREIGERGLTNIRILQHDAVEVLDHMLTPGALAGVHIYFPDPWHKKRHHKRRLIQPPFVERLASRLAVDGWLHCATDWQDYAEQMLEVLEASPLLVNATGPGQYAPRPDMRPMTKFERRGLQLGHGVWDLLYRRRAD